MFSPNEWLLFAIFVSSKSFSPLFKNYWVACVYSTELTGIDRFFPSENFIRSPELLGVVLEHPEMKVRIDLLCCMGVAYLVIFTWSPHEKEKKAHLSIRASWAILVMEIIIDCEVSSAFHFLIIFTTHASNKPIKVSTFQMGNGL